MEKKLSINKLDKLIKAASPDRNCVAHFCVEENDIDIVVKSYLLPHEEYSCAQSIASSVFMEGVYAPEVLESSIIMNFFAYYTNIKIEAGLDRAYALWYGCVDVRERLLGMIDLAQWNKIQEAARQSIRHRLNMEVCEQATRLNELTQQLDNATAVLNTMTQTFSGISEETMLGAINQLASLDEKKVIGLVAEAQKRREEQ